MKEMIYQQERIRGRFEILDSGQIDGYAYFITSLGTHPCAYIILDSDDALYGLDIWKNNIQCHGGITWSNSYLWSEDYLPLENPWVIGWDYAHYDDYVGYFPNGPGHKWTTAEILAEVRDVIKQVKEINNEKQSNRSKD